MDCGCKQVLCRYGPDVVFVCVACPAAEVVQWEALVAAAVVAAPTYTKTVGVVQPRVIAC